MMILRRLTLNNFRNFHFLQLDVGPKLNFFWGENAQGKTNLIEGIFLACQGESFRPLSPQSLIRKSESFGLVDVEFTKGDCVFHIRCRLTSDGRKKIWLNQKPISRSKLMSLFPVILFTPDSLGAMKGSPENRRQLLDEFIFLQNPTHVDEFADFQRILRQRNKILSLMAEGKVGPGDEETLLSINLIYFPLAARVAHLRLQSIAALEPDFRNMAQQILDESRENLNIEHLMLDYLISDQSARSWSEEKILTVMKQRHQELERAERSSGVTLVGPHRHDVQFMWCGQDVRYFCSQGQQRALILAFKIAQIVYHRKVHRSCPLLLLDDVLSELDFKKRTLLMKLLIQTGAQILLTSTEDREVRYALAADLDTHSCYSVMNGHLIPAPSDVLTSVSQLEN